MPTKRGISKVHKEIKKASPTGGPVGESEELDFSNLGPIPERIPITESNSNYENIELMSTRSILKNINKEDSFVAGSIQEKIPAIEKLVKAIYLKMKSGGRLFYLGSGTSGRLGILDASELPPTFGVPHGKVIGIIAGGDTAIRKAVEFAEDDELGGWNDLKKFKITKKDFVIGIAASGTTPYVVGALKKCRKKGIMTGAITCNIKTPIVQNADFPIEILVGPEFITGSTRMKAGTAQKMVLNMISTSVMILLGKVKGNKMVDMQLTNTKLIRRGTKMIMEEFGLDKTTAEKLLLKYKSVRKVIASRS